MHSRNQRNNARRARDSGARMAALLWGHVPVRQANRRLPARAPAAPSLTNYYKWKTTSAYRRPSPATLSRFYAHLDRNLRARPRNRFSNASATPASRRLNNLPARGWGHLTPRRRNR